MTKDVFQENDSVTGELNAPMEKSRLDFVDLLKAIAIYCVLMYHFPISKFDFLSVGSSEIISVISLKLCSAHLSPYSFLLMADSY